MPYSYEWYGVFIRITWLIHTCDMTHSCVWHDSFIRVIRLILIRVITHFDMWHDSFSFVTRNEKRGICCQWLILIFMLLITLFVRDMTHHDVLLSIPYPNSDQSKLIRDMTHCHLCHDLFSFVTWHIKTYCYQYHIQTGISQNSFVTWLILIRDNCSSWPILIRDMTAPHEPFSFVTFVTGSVVIWYIENTLNSPKRCRGRGTHPPLRFMSRMRTSHVTIENESCHHWEWVMSRLRFHYISNHYKAILWEIVPEVGLNGSRAFTKKKKCTRSI